MQSSLSFPLVNSNLDQKFVSSDIKDPLGALVSKIPEFSFPRTDTGLNKILFGTKKSKIFELKAGTKLEVETRFDEQVQLKLPALPSINDEICLVRPYLKNPRFRSEEMPSNLVAEPSRICFSNYLSNKSYSTQLVIRNISGKSIRFRLQYSNSEKISEFFQFELLSSPIDQEGLVAPGLFCSYNIKFRPNSLGRFSEQLTVISESGEYFEVPITASREIPILSLPETIECDPCRPGYSTSKKIRIKNSGGAGKFLVLSGNDQRTPFEIFDRKEYSDSDCIQLSSFYVCPRYFSLAKNESITVTFTYSPLQMASSAMDIEELLIACDNCEILKYTLKGCMEKPRLDVLNASFQEQGRIVTQFTPDEIFDFELDFQSFNTDDTETCVLSVKNATGLQLPFRWAQSDYRKGQKMKEFCQPSAFECLPQTGLIDPYQELVLIIKFKPDLVKAFDTVAELLLLGEVTENPDYSTNQSILANQNSQCITRARLLGSGSSHKLISSTKLISLPPDFYSGLPYSSTFTLSNQSASSIEYTLSIENFDSSKVDIVLSHIKGALAPDCSAEVIVTTCGSVSTFVSAKILCTIGSRKDPILEIALVGDILKARNSISFGVGRIDFGLCALGDTKSIILDVINESNNTCDFDLSIAGFEKCCILSLNCCSGRLAPNQKLPITVTYTPTWYHTLQEALLLKETAVEVDSKKFIFSTPVLMSALNIVAIVQTPRIVVLNPENMLSCFINVPIKWKLLLKNTRRLRAYYSWTDISDESVRISFSPKAFFLEGGTAANVEIQVCYLRTGVYQTFVTGSVKDMVEDQGNLQLKISANVVQCNFSFRVLENEKAWDERRIMGTKEQKSSEASLRLDFGLLCPISAVRTRTIKVRNHSAIESSFQLTCHTYNPFAEALQQNSAENQNSNVLYNGTDG